MKMLIICLDEQSALDKLMMRADSNKHTLLPDVGGCSLRGVSGGGVGGV